jgi:hypothetical protein
MQLGPRDLDYLDLDLVTGVLSPPNGDGGHLSKVGPEDRRVEPDPAHPVHVDRDIVEPDQPFTVLRLQVVDLKLLKI